MQHTHQLEIRTRGKGLYPFTRDVAAWVASAQAKTGLLTLFIQHTSASLVIQENADPDVVLDLADFFERIAPQDTSGKAPRYRHDTEGPDDMPAHIKTMLTSTSLQIPVLDGELALGTWQAIYLIEHRARPHRREVVLQFIGST
jgi:secondary thiamine-phosphate synthase enzyme